MRSTHGKSNDRLRTIKVPVLTEALERLGIPLSLGVASNGLLFLSGIPPIDVRTGEIRSGTISEQCKLAMEAVDHCLCAGSSDFDHVISTRIYASNAGYYDEINQVYRKFFRSHLPARTFVPVGSWPGAFDIEIECVALQSGSEVREA
ncbi:MAG: RidA family protein [Pseudomonadota bacterium]